MKLMSLIESIFPEDKHDLPSDLEQFWTIRNQLYVLDGVVMRYDDVVVPHALHQDILSQQSKSKQCRVIIPESLRTEVLQVLHAAHQGVSAMHERAKAGVYWPGITKDISRIRDTCSSCNLIAPSNPRHPPADPQIPKTSFEAVVCDFFTYRGWYYFVAAERLSR